MKYPVLVLKVIHSALFWAVFQFLFIITYLISLVTLMFPRSGHLILRFFLSIFIRSVFILGLVRVRVEGKKNLLGSLPAILVSNMPGVMEPLFLIAFVPAKFRIMAEKKMFEIPLLKTIMRALHNIIISEGQGMEFIKDIYSASRNKESMIIFPEEGGSFREGALKIAKSLSWPVIPVVIKGSQRVFPKSSLIITPGVVEIRIGQPLDPQAISNQELYEIFSAIYTKE